MRSWLAATVGLLVVATVGADAAAQSVKRAGKPTRMPSAWVVVDADGNQVGVPVSANVTTYGQGLSANVLLEASGYPVLLQVEETRILGASYLVYSTSGCAGTPYWDVAAFNQMTFFGPAAAVWMNTIYIADPSATPQYVSVQSFRSLSADTCSEYSAPQIAVAVPAIATTTLSFLPPFKVILK